MGYGSTIEASSPKLTRGLGATLFGLYAAALLVQLDSAVFAPLLPALAHDFGASIAAVGLAVSFYTIPYGFCQLAYGPLADRIGKLTVIRWTFLIFAFGTGLCGLAGSLLALDGLRLVTGVCAAAAFPMSLAFIGDVVPYEQRKQAIATLNGASSLGTALSAAVGGMIGQFVSWRALFWFYGVFGLLVTANMFRNARLMAAPPAATSEAKGDRWQLLRLPRAQLLYVQIALEGTFVWGGFTFLGAYLNTRFGVSYFIIGLVLACYGFGTVATSRLLPRVLPLFGETGLILWGGGLLAASWLLFLVLPAWPIFVVPMLTLGAGFAFYHLILQTRATELVPGMRGTSVALFAFSLFLGRGIGTAILGWIVTTAGYEALILFCGLGMLGLTVLTWRTLAD